MSSQLSSQPRLETPQSNFRILAPWYAIEFLNSYACTLVLLCVPYLLKESYHRLPGDALWQSAGWGIMYVPFAFLAGKFADRWGPRTLLVRAATFAVPAAAVGLAAIGVHNVWVLFAVLIVFNLGNTAGWPALEAAITRSPGNVRLSTRTGIYNVIWSSAGFFAFPTADLVRTLGWPAMFLIPTAICFISALVARFATIPESMLVSSASAEDDTHEAPSANARSLLLMAWVANPMAYVAINVLMAVMPRVSPVAVSLGSIWKLTTVVSFILWWKWPGWHYKTSLMLLAYAGLMSSFGLILGFADPTQGTPAAILVPAQILFGLSVSLIYSGSLYYAMHVSSGGGSHAGMHEALIGVGVALGCTAGALASNSPSLTPIVLAVTAILLVGGGIIATLAILSARTKPSNA